MLILIFRITAFAINADVAAGNGTVGKFVFMGAVVFKNEHTTVIPPEFTLDQTLFSHKGDALIGLCSDRKGISLVKAANTVAVKDLAVLILAVDRYRFTVLNETTRLSFRAVGQRIEVAVIGIDDILRKILFVARVIDGL